MATQTGELGVTFPDDTLQTTAAIAGAPGFGGFTRMSVYTTTSFWVVPAGVTTCKVTVIAGGYSGGPFASNSVSDPPSYYGGSGGPSGGAAIKIITGLTPGTSISVTVGAGGIGGGDYSGPGGTSSFGAYCSATSGGIGIGGNLNVSATGGTSGGGGNSGYVSFFTGTGGPSILGSYGSGGGGGGYYDNGYPGKAGVVIVEY